MSTSINLLFKTPVVVSVECAGLGFRSISSANFDVAAFVARLVHLVHLV